MHPILNFNVFRPYCRGTDIRLDDSQDATGTNSFQAMASAIATQAVQAGDLTGDEDTLICLNLEKPGLCSQIEENEAVPESVRMMFLACESTDRKHTRGCDHKLDKHIAVAKQDGFQLQLHFNLRESIDDDMAELDNIKLVSSVSVVVLTRDMTGFGLQTSD